MFRCILVAVVLVVFFSGIPTKAASMLDDRGRRAATCNTGEFMCDTNRCIPAFWLCNDADDCTDGTDETVVDCTMFGCFGFGCMDGQCLPASKICDQTPDCADGADEDWWNCPQDGLDPDCDDVNGICQSNWLYCDGIYSPDVTCSGSPNYKKKCCIPSPDTTTASPPTASTPTASLKRDPHVMTFDGLKYNFNGYCSYSLIKSCDDVIYPPFEITADFRGRDPYLPYEPPTFMEAFNITSNGKQIIRINQDDVVLIKGKPMTSSSAVIGDDEGDVKLENNRIMVYLKEPALSLTWNRRIHGIQIGLNDIKLRGKVCGLLGNDDGNPHNEFIKPDGERTFDADEYGNSWLIPDSCP